MGTFGLYDSRSAGPNGSVYSGLYDSGARGSKTVGREVMGEWRAAGEK